MLKKFKITLQELGVDLKKSRILVAVSGGIDSIVMLHLFYQCKAIIGIAHCNFLLRAQDSDNDEDFVCMLAQKYNVPFYSKKFKTQHYAAQKGISIQMAARELRYEWFNHLQKKYGYNFIAIAHNQNDSVETILLNLARGTGIRGLSGISIKNNTIIRPLLFASRNEITTYCKKKILHFREDLSNAENKYARNLIRNKIIPLFYRINPNFINTVLNNSILFNDIQQLINTCVYKAWNDISEKRDNNIYIDINKLLNYSPLSLYLYEMLSIYGFDRDTIENISQSLKKQSGKIFYSSSHIIIKDRKHLILCDKNELNNSNLSYSIHRETKQIDIPVRLHIKHIKNSNKYKINTSQLVAQLDYDQLKFPLIIRKWRKGDRFVPLGMKKEKKLSDFFIDEKFSVADKKNCWLLTSSNDIVWVIGKRISNLYKITSKTKNIYWVGIK